MTIGDRIRALREVRGFGRLELARLAGMSRSGIMMIENGHRDPRLATLRAIARALRVAPGDLMGRKAKER